MHKNDFFDLNDVQIIPVVVAEWGRTVYVRSFSAGTRAKIASLWKKYDQENRTSELGIFFIIFSMCDEDGKLIFSVDDVEKLNELNANALDVIAAAAIKLNQMNSTDDAKKN